MAQRGRSGRKVGTSPTSCKKCHFGLRQTRKVTTEEGVRKESKTEYVCAPPGYYPEVVENTEEGTCPERRGGLRFKQLFVERF